MTAPLLSVRDLAVDLRRRAGTRRLLDGVSLDLAPGEILGLVGDSGSGKTLLSRAVLGLLPAPDIHIASGRVLLDGRDLTAAGEPVLRTVRGGAIGMVFQNPTSHLDPVMRVGEQVAQGIRRHGGLPPAAARAAATELLAQVGLPDPDRRYAGYPHEFSVGMRQRAMIAVALSCHPRILLADEPTSALDVRTQAQILRLLLDLRRQRDLAMILVSHDPAVVARTCDRVAVLRDGRIVEPGRAPRLPRTVRPGRTDRTRTSAAGAAPLLEIEGLEVRYRRDESRHRGVRLPRRGRGVVALRGIHLQVRAGEAVGLVGESGSGKSTLARAALGLTPITAGRIRFAGADLADDHRTALAALRRDAALVFQDPDNALNPRLTIGQALAEVLSVRGRTAPPDIARRVAELLDLVALDRTFAGRRPRTMSGGQCQRAGIARALAGEPRLLIADECVAGLDVTNQTQIVALLDGLRRRTGLALLFIAHDLALVHRLCDRVLVLCRGEIVEEGRSAEVMAHPRHPHTAALIAASPGINLDEERYA